jgi:hypothetical protein
MDTTTGKVYWHWRNRPNMQQVPVWVWGYEGTPVTGDYDMWMVAPHISMLAGGVDIYSNKDAHGRSAASGFTTKFIQALNTSCGRLERPVFNHGAEAQNVSFTQAMDKRLVIFCPGLMHPFMLSRVLLPGILHDLLLQGYLVVRNPKWINGVTLGIEDMADAAGKFPEDPAVKAGVKAMDKLKQAAGSKIAEWYRKKKGLTPSTASSGWQERYGQLRYFRAIGHMPDATSSLETLMLPPRAFPSSGAGSAPDATRSVVALGKELEANFKRTGFLQEDGHVSPVDETAGSNQPGKVKGMIKDWESRKGGK